MSEETTTDLFYDFVMKLEHKSKWLFLLVLIYLVLAALGLLVNGLGFMLFNHQKSGTIDINAIITSINLVICTIFLMAGINQYLTLRYYNSKLKKIQALEDKIYEEVLRPR